MPWAAAAAVAGAAITAYGANSAADTQADASRDASAVSQRQYDQTRADQTPWRDAGKGALDLITPGIQPGGDFNRSFTLGDFTKDPGYQFRMDEGMKGLQGSAAARGGLLSGGTLKSLSRYGQDYASGEYQNAYNRYNTDLTNRFNRLSSVAGIGQTANNALATAGNQNVNNQTSAINGGANARASGYVGTANAVSGAASTLGNWYQQRQLMGNSSTPDTNNAAWTNFGGSGNDVWYG